MFVTVCFFNVEEFSLIVEWTGTLGGRGGGDGGGAWASFTVYDPL
jgi:hypothetical protein